MTSPFRRAVLTVLAFIVATASVNLSGVAQLHSAYAASNNGTLQVHEKGESAYKPGNSPQVCVFNFEVFNLDPSQTGAITIQAKNPTDPIIPVVIPLTTDALGNGSTSPYVNDQGSPYYLADGHYEAVLDNKFGTDAGDKAKSKVFWVKCATPSPTAITPTAPSFVDQCGTANDTYTIPATTGVTYRVNGTPKTAGVYPASGNVTITATANTGYILQGMAQWSARFTNWPCVVVPAQPTKNDLCGRVDDTYTIPSTTGVKYFVNGVEKQAGTYTAPKNTLIIAVAKPGYVIDIRNDFTWLLRYTNDKCPEPCHPLVPLRLVGPLNRAQDPDCIPVIVVTGTPSMTDVCEMADDLYVIPSTTGVVYKVNDHEKAPGEYAGKGTIVITAHAADSGYVIADGQTKRWTFEFTDEPCPRAEISATAACDARGVLVTLTNDGDADGTVYVNDSMVTVAAGETVEVIVPTVLYKTSVRVVAVDRETVLYDSTSFDCTPGQGSTGELPVPGSPALVTRTVTQSPTSVSELPETGIGSWKQLYTGFILAVVTYGLTYYLQGRRKLSDAE